MVFSTIGICYYFYVFFQIQKVVTFYVFLPCFVRFLELWWHLLISGSKHVNKHSGYVHTDTSTSPSTTPGLSAQVSKGCTIL